MLCGHIQLCIQAGIRMIIEQHDSFSHYLSPKAFYYASVLYVMRTKRVPNPFRTTFNLHVKCQCIVPKITCK